jgi:hypothetical protein
MSQPGIIKEFKSASENPKADESKKLMSKILPIVKLAGQRSEFGPIARNECISKITAMVRTFFLNMTQGLIPYFVTMKMLVLF